MDPRRLPSSVAAALIACLWALRSRADLPSEGSRIESSDYAIDLTQTPVLASTRVTALSGAFVAIGEGTDGSAQNPAAVAHRVPWSVGHFDYDLSFALTFSSQLRNSDLFNSGKTLLTGDRSRESFVFLNLAANLQWGRWGFGIASDIQRYALGRASSTAAEQQDELVGQFAVTRLSAGYALHAGEILIGLGSRTITLNVNNENAPSGDDEDLFEAFGTGYEIGLLVRPNETRYRFGAAFRSAVGASAGKAGEALYVGDPDNQLVLPERVSLPWDLNLGFALQFGSRPLNPRWIDPSIALETQEHQPGSNLEKAEKEISKRLEERYLAMERFYVLVTGSLGIIGPVPQAVGVESFLERRVQRSGLKASFSPRLGVETEAIPHYTRFRAGTYLEPSRFDSNPNGARWHATFGFEQRVLSWNVFGLWPDRSVFRVSGALDVSRAYLSWGIGIGMWH